MPNTKSSSQLSSTHLSVQQQNQLRSLLEQGLAKVSKPYQQLAQAINSTEDQVITQIEQWQNSGLIRRLGLVVKHRKLGYTANAMVVWDIPDFLIEPIANQLASFKQVSLCYRRPRHLPEWPYNLFCMIHGKDRNIVLKQIENIYLQLIKDHKLIKIDLDILFSNKAYKQQGARYQHQKNVLQQSVNMQPVTEYRYG